MASAPTATAAAPTRPVLHTAATTTGASAFVMASTSTSTSQSQYGHMQRPSMGERAMTAMSSATTLGAGSSIIESPVQSGSIANRIAHAQYGLYQQCLTLQKRLRRVPGFSERYLNSGAGAATSTSETNNLDSEAQQQSPISPTTAVPLSSENDPVNVVCGCLRLGASLAYIFNLLGEGKPLEVDPDATPTNLKACKKSAAHFIMACNTRLGWPYEEMFTATELLSQSTNGTVKVLSTVSKLLNLLEERGLLIPDQEEDQQSLASTSLDTRGKVIKEILESERKYVQDIEVLQEYKRKLAEESIISQDTIHYIFLNLDEIVDFARKFLVLVEQTCSQPLEQQRFGNIFLVTEDQFSVYNKYCSHFESANDLAASIARQENSPLARLSHILDPIVELTMFHIKPLQRVTKYHLLFKQLVKESDVSAPFYAELVEGTAAAERIADRINEAIRKEENRAAVEDLRQRVEDWKGHELGLFGELVLHDTFQVLKNDVEREYSVYLFQKIILCCKEVVPNPKAKVNKSNSMIRKSAGSTANGAQPRRKPPLQLKGRIFINNVVSANPSRANPVLLQVTWRGDTAEEAFGIKCRTLEQLGQWQKAVMKAVEEMAMQRRSRSAGQLSARRLASPHSQFPNTPQCELGPLAASGHSGDGHLYHNGSSVSLGSSNYNPYGGTFEDGEDDGYVGDYDSTGRSTPSLTSERGAAGSSRRGPGTQSMPASIRQDRMGENGRPRAQTEDSNSAVIHQWRSQTPNGSQPAVPSLPRQSSATSTHDPSLRHSASRNALRHKQSQEWSTSSSTLPPSSSSSTVTPQGSASLPPGMGRNLSQQMEELAMAGEPLRMLRQNSQGNLPPHTAPPAMRSRSASSPNVYQLTPAQIANMPEDGHWSPYPVENVHPSHFAPSAGQMPHGNIDRQQGNIPLRRNERANMSTATIASTNGSSTTAPPNRLSSSSTGTDQSSGDSTQSQGLPYTSPTSPTGPVHYSRTSTPQAPMSPSSAVKLRVNYGDFTFVLVVLSTITYFELVEKVVRKIHLCGARNGVDTTTLRLRYEDEENDKILISADEDVMMAFDWLRSGNAGQANVLVLYAD